MHNKKRIWQIPWGYRESIVIVLGIVLVGFMLQATIGKFDFYLLSFPFNLYFGILSLAFIVLSVFLKRKSFFIWFTSLSFSVSLIGAITFLSIIMGLTKQVPIVDRANIFTLLGFNQMTSSWAFVLIYFLLLLSLGSTIAKRKPRLTKQYLVFILNHIGLWLILFFAGLGYSDLNRYIMYVEIGETQWRVYDKDSKVVELPIAIQLNSFTIEQYIPKLAVIDKKTGEVLPKDKPIYFQIDTNSKEEFSFNGYKIRLKNYIHNAVRSSDSSYKEVPMKASCPAALVEIRNNNKVKSHWISAGNKMQSPMFMDIDSNLALVMTPSEPKSFISNIEVYTQEGGYYKEENLRVNHPLKAGSWRIYQYGYDNNMGKMSSYSSFELVYDPWLNMVYLGIGLLALGSLLLIIFGKNYKK
jgi:hypothetical protein